MLLDDAATDDEAEPGAGRLGGAERHEQHAQLLFADPRPTVFDLQLGSSVGQRLGGDAHFAFSSIACTAFWVRFSSTCRRRSRSASTRTGCCVELWMRKVGLCACCRRRWVHSSAHSSDRSISARLQRGLAREV